MHETQGTAVVIPTLGRVELVAQLCMRLMDLTVRPDIIVPAFQRDEEFKAFQRQRLPHAVRPTFSLIRGAGPARNAGVAALPSTISYVAFLDDDVSPISDSWLQHILDPLERPGVIAVTGPIHNWEAHRRTPLLPPGRANIVVPGIMHPLGNPVRRHDGWAGSVWGGNFAISKNAFDSIGGFHPRFSAPSLFEETELSLRLRRLMGGKIFYSSRAAIRHEQAPGGGQRATESGFSGAFVGSERTKLLEVLEESDPWPLPALRTKLGVRSLKVLSQLRRR